MDQPDPNYFQTSEKGLYKSMYTYSTQYKFNSNSDLKLHLLSQS